MRYCKGAWHYKGRAYASLRAALVKAFQEVRSR